MAEKTMADYLSVIVADYTVTDFDLAPQRIMREEPVKKQVLHEYDDGTETGINLSSTDFFNITLEWAAIELSPAGTIMDLWHDTNKANGKLRSWYLQHPLETNIYVVKFRGPLTRMHIAGATSWLEIPQVPLRVIGKKAS